MVYAVSVATYGYIGGTGSIVNNLTYPLVGTITNNDLAGAITQTTLSGTITSNALSGTIED